MRRFAAALLLGTLLLPLGARGATGCPMVTDLPTGDAVGLANGTKAPVSDPAMDVKQVDMVTDATRIKVQAVLDQYTLFDTYAATGRMLDFEISAKNGPAQHVRIVIDPTGNVSSTPAGTAKMETTGAVWAAVPLSALGFDKMRPSTVRPRRTGDRYTSLKVTVYRYANGKQVGDPVDEAGGTLALPWYVHRARACITI